MKQVQDHYFHKAKRAGYVARSAFKLEEIDRRHGLLRPGMRVLDLGAAPGSWMQYAAKRVGSGGTVIGVDLQEITVALPSQALPIQEDAFDLDEQALPADTVPFDVILSDMAPSTTGIRSADADRSAELVLRALALAMHLLRPGGALLVKGFQGARLPAVRGEFRQAFGRVTLEKPKASRPESVEVFLLGLDKRTVAGEPGRGATD